jgi:hypothetical protein
VCKSGVGRCGGCAHARAVRCSASAVQCRTIACTAVWCGQTPLQVGFYGSEGDSSHLPGMRLSRFCKHMTGDCSRIAEGSEAPAGPLMFMRCKAPGNTHDAAYDSFSCAFVFLCCSAGDHPIAGDRLKRYLAIGASLATARAHKVGPIIQDCMYAGFKGGGCGDYVGSPSG